MRTLLFGLCVVFGAMCSQASAGDKCCDEPAVVVVRPFARVLVVRKSDTVVVVDRPFLLFPWRSQVIVVRGK